MTHHAVVRDALPSDAPAFANSQIEAWRAAYAGTARIRTRSPLSSVMDLILKA